MTLILDAGALIAIERRNPRVTRMLEDERQARRVPVTHGGIVGQVWRGGARQAVLASLLPGLEIRPLDETLGRQAGALLAVARTSDVIDAALVLLAEDGDWIFTSDPGDIERLVEAARVEAEVIAI